MTIWSIVTLVKPLNTLAIFPFHICTEKEMEGKIENVKNHGHLSFHRSIYGILSLLAKSVWL